MTHRCTHCGDRLKHLVAKVWKCWTCGRKYEVTS